MRLLMILGERTLDAVELAPHRCKQPGYMEAMMRCLRMKHWDAIEKAGSTAQFYLEVPSKMNKEEDSQVNSE